MDWELEDAQGRVSELFDRVLSNGPQRICCGDRSVIMLDARAYEELIAGRQPFIELLRSGPGLDGVDLTRDQTPMRDVDL
jgi:hypothetical protein